MVSKNIKCFFPPQLAQFFHDVWEDGDLEEIRLRMLKPICIIKRGKEYFLDRQGNLTDRMKNAKILSEEELKHMINHICQYSLYAYEEEVRQGFIAIPGGHRVGLAGQVVLDKDRRIKTIKYINGLNIRISHEIKGAADILLPYIYDDGRVLNTVIIAPPGCGKTTLLRDLVRQISDGNRFGQGMCVSLVDERSEIAGCFRGEPQNDVGVRTDVLDGCPKSEGIMLLIRSMSPKVIAIDELGETEEWRALLHASYCGVALVATMHGVCVEDYEERLCRNIPEGEGLFKRSVVLEKRGGKCLITRIYKMEGAGGWKCIYQK